MKTKIFIKWFLILTTCIALILITTKSYKNELLIGFFIILELGVIFTSGIVSGFSDNKKEE